MVKIGDVEINPIGLGTNRQTDTPDNREFLQFAVKQGVNFIDTAHLYTGGQSEITIGNALAPYDENLVIATKGGYDDVPDYNSEEYLRANLEQSLHSLKTDRIKLYQLHRVDSNRPLSQTLNVLSKFRDGGIIDHIGLSEVTVEQIKEAQKHVEILSVQNQYSLTFRKHEVVLDYCTANGIIFIPWFPLRDINGDPAVQAKLKPIADKYDATPQQLVLAWLLKRSPMMLPIPGTLSKQHLLNNLAAANISLSDEDYEQITHL